MRTCGTGKNQHPFRTAIDHELEAARPLRDNGYKVPLIRNIVVRALSRLAEMPA